MSLRGELTHNDLGKAAIPDPLQAIDEVVSVFGGEVSILEATPDGKGIRLTLAIKQLAGNTLVGQGQGIVIPFGEHRKSQHGYLTNREPSAAEIRVNKGNACLTALLG